MFERDPLVTADFIEKTLKTYFDYGLTIRKFWNDFRQGIREEYLDGN
jgi:hypothetical protein